MTRIALSGYPRIVTASNLKSVIAVEYSRYIRSRSELEFLVERGPGAAAHPSSFHWERMGARPRARTVIVNGTVGSGLLWRHEVAGSAYFVSQLRMRNSAGSTSSAIPHSSPRSTWLSSTSEEPIRAVSKWMGCGFFCSVRHQLDYLAPDRTASAVSPRSLRVRMLNPSCRFASRSPSSSTLNSQWNHFGSAKPSARFSSI